MGQAMRLLSVATGKPLTANQFNSMVASFVMHYQRDAAANQQWFDNAFAAVVIEPYSNTPQIALIGRDGVMWTANKGYTQVIMNEVPAARPNPIANVLANPVNANQWQNVPQGRLGNKSFAAEVKMQEPRFAVPNLSTEKETAGVIVNGQIKIFADASAGETEIHISESAYADLNGVFVPFHTHLGHPRSFHGAARFAPTAEDVLAHRYLMTKYAKTHGTSLDVPGVIFHASGEITLFWAGATDSDPVRLTVIHPSGARENALTTIESLAVAAESGELNLVMMGEGLLRGMEQAFHSVDLWDPRMRLGFSA
jgi:hypothetical protein